MFEKLSEMAGLVKKLGEVKSKMKTMQEELSKLVITGKCANGAVEIDLSGDMAKVLRVSIRPEYLTPRNRAALESCVAEALADTLTKVRQESTRRLGDVTGGVDLPGLMN